MEDLREKYKPNSAKSKAESEEPKKEVHQVTSKPAQIRKKSPGRKFLESFIADDVVSIKDYILYDVILPAIKNTIVDGVTNCVQMIFWGGQKAPSNMSRTGGKTYVSYGNYSSMSSNSSRRDIDTSSRSRHDFNDIIIDNRGEAEDILSQLVDLIDNYGRASVSDLYYMTGLQSTPIDQKWGWRDLSSASVIRVREGYLLKLPKVTLIQ